MDLSKIKRCDQFVDKAQAVGMVACLEDHFRRISKRLDDAGLPNDEVAPLTVEQRVAILIEAFSVELATTTHGRQKLFDAVTERVLANVPDEGNIDPEELEAWINSEEKCEGCKAPATKHDDEGVPLCDADYEACAEETERDRKIAEARAEGIKRHGGAYKKLADR